LLIIPPFTFADAATVLPRQHSMNRIIPDIIMPFFIERSKVKTSFVVGKKE
jgi:hypothetical protein